MTKNKDFESVENEIANYIADKNENYSNSEIKELIKREIDNRNYLVEDWQIKHAVKRIENKINEIENSRLVGNEILFQIEDLRADGLNIFALQYYDILITDSNLFLIKIPKGYLRLIGLIVGLSLGLLGGLLGAFIGSCIEAHKRSKYRKSWMDDSEIKIKRDMDLKIPCNRAKESIIFNSKRIVINYNNKEIQLKAKRKKIKQLKDFVYSKL